MEIKEIIKIGTRFHDGEREDRIIDYFKDLNYEDTSFISTLIEFDQIASKAYIDATSYKLLDNLLSDLLLKIAIGNMDVELGKYLQYIKPQPGSMAAGLGKVWIDANKEELQRFYQKYCVYESLAYSRGFTIKLTTNLEEVEKNMDTSCVRKRTEFLLNCDKSNEIGVLGLKGRNR